MGELAGRCAVVTGGSRGIGRAVAQALAAAGARVVITGRNAATGAGAVTSITDAGGAAQFVPADQANPADWPGVIAAAEGGEEGFDILVLNAGVSGAGPIGKTTLGMFRHVCDLNLKGAFIGLQNGVAAMRRRGQGGSVVLVASIVGKIGVADHAAYSASKGGLRLMAKAAALELGPEHIRVNSLHPGLIRTDMTAGFDEPSMAALAPLGRFGEASEVAAAALFLASDRARFVTGTELVVDGGWIAR